MAFPFVPVLAVAGLGALGYWAFKKPTPQPGMQPHPTVLPGPSGVPGFGANAPVVSIPQPGGGAITIDLPVGISSDVYQVVNAPNQLLLRSAPNVDGHAPGQGNVIGALPNDSMVKKVPGSDLQNGFMQVYTIPGAQKGFAYADYLAKVDVLQGISA